MRYILPTLLVLAACAPEADRAAEPQPDGCGAAGHAGLIGQAVATVDTAARADTVRLLPPGSMMTMDHRPDRLNIDTDTKGLITRLWCG